jgi:hypothetical protein
MFFVLVLEIDGEISARAFHDADQARACYAEAARVCMDGPDDEDGETPYPISDCWLYSADTLDEDAACQDALAGRANLIDAYSLL